MTLRFFATPEALRQWFQKNHDRLTEAAIGFYKKASGKPSVTYHEALDQALCFGWIDGVRRRVDDEAFQVRFTPRKPKSIWSLVNQKRYAALLEAGQVSQAGQAAFARHDPARTPAYSFENKDQPLDAEHAAEFRQQAEAWEFFHAQAPSYQRAARWWVRSAKQEATRGRRLAQLIADSAAGRRLAQLTSPSRRKESATTKPARKSAGKQAPAKKRAIRQANQPRKTRKK